MNNYIKIRSKCLYALLLFPSLILAQGINIGTGASVTVSGAATISIVDGNFVNDGTYTTGAETVIFSGTVAETITGATTFNNLTVSNTAGVTAGSDQTVNGVLNLTTNPNATHGALDMASYTLNMGASATNTGVGDVTGIVKRQQTFAGNTAYCFGNQYTTISFVNFANSVKPAWVSCKLTLGTAPSWRSTNINRTYSFAQDGTGTDRTITNLHYLDSELHDAETDETKLVFWDAYTGPTYATVNPRGKSNNNATNNWIGLTGMAINFIATSTTLDVKQWGLGYTNVAKITWTGNGSPTYSGDWSLPGNWNGGVPTASDDVLIPTTLPADTHGYPTRNLNTGTVPSVCKTMEIEPSATVTVDNYDITVNGSVGAWINNGTFTPGSGTVYFANGNTSNIASISGTSSFNNLTVNANTYIQPTTGSLLKIAGSLTPGSGSILDFIATNNTIEYNGTSTQTVINPVGPSSDVGYYSLTLSGSSSKTMPASALSVQGDFSMSGTASATLLGALTTLGNVTLGAGTTLTAGAYTHLVGGNWTNNGATFTNTGSTIDMNGTVVQAIGGSSSNSFNNLNISNTTAAVTATNDIAVSNILTLGTSGILDMGSNLLTSLGSSSGSGTIKTQNTSTAPVPSGKTWAGRIDYNAASAQTAVAGTFGNIDINNAAGVSMATTATAIVTGILLINSGKSLQIGTGTAMNAQTVTNNAGTSGLLIKSNATDPNGSLIFNNAYGSPVAASVQMYTKSSKPATSYKWQFFGVPLRTLSAFPTFNGSYVRKFNEAGTGTGTTSDKHWIQLSNGNSLTPFTGYEVTQVSPTTFTFRGDLVNSDYASGKLPFTPTAQYTGQHLIGNPYTAAIDISKIEFGSKDPTKIENTIYLYNTGSYSEWQSYNSGAPSASETELPGQYVSVPKSAAGTNGLPSQIPSMQAFLVMVASDNDSATVSIPYSAAGTIVKNTTKQRSRASENVSTRIEVKGASFGDKMWIISQPNCTREFDNGWDGYKNYSSGVTQLFAMETSGDYQVNAVDNINNTFLGFQAGATDTYTMTFTNENIETQYSVLYLIDLLNNNKVTDITASGTTYTFTSTATSVPDKRFKIVTNLGTVTDYKTTSNDIFKVYCSQNTVFVNNNSNLSGNLQICDITGRCIQNIMVSANNISSYPLNLPAGSYIVKAKVGNEEAVKRIILE